MPPTGTGATLLTTLADQEPPVTGGITRHRFQTGRTRPGSRRSRSRSAWRRCGVNLADVTGEDRRMAVAALVDAAVRATGWRQAAGMDPATVPFPGAT